MIRLSDSPDIPRYVRRHATNQAIIFSTRVTINREEATPYRHPMTVDVLLKPILTEGGLLYEPTLMIFGAVGDPLFNEIWDSLSQRISLPDPALREEFPSKSGHFYFSVKVYVPPEKIHDAVVDFVSERCDPSKFRVHYQPRDLSYLKRDYTLLPHRMMLLRSTSRSYAAILRAVHSSASMIGLLLPCNGGVLQEDIDLLIDTIKNDNLWQEVQQYFCTNKSARFAWEEGLG